MLVFSRPGYDVTLQNRYRNLAYPWANCNWWEAIPCFFFSRCCCCWCDWEEEKWLHVRPDFWRRSSARCEMKMFTWWFQVTLWTKQTSKYCIWANCLHRPFLAFFLMLCLKGLREGDSCTCLQMCEEYFGYKWGFDTYMVNYDRPGIEVKLSWEIDNFLLFCDVVNDATKRRRRSHVPPDTLRSNFGWNYETWIMRSGGFWPTWVRCYPLAYTSKHCIPVGKLSSEKQFLAFPDVVIDETERSKMVALATRCVRLDARLKCFHGNFKSRFRTDTEVLHMSKSSWETIFFLLFLTVRWLMRLSEEDGWMCCFWLIRHRIDDRSRSIRVGGNSGQGASRPGPHHLLPHRRHSCSVGRTLLRRAFKPLPVGRQRLSLRLHLCRWRVSITPCRLRSPDSTFKVVSQLGSCS